MPELYDIVAVECEKIINVSIWKKLSIERAINLSGREQKIFDDADILVGLVLSGTGSVGRKVEKRMQSFEFSGELVIDGRKIPQKPTRKVTRMFSIIN